MGTNPFENKVFVESLKFAKPEHILDFQKSVETAGIMSSETDYNTYVSNAYVDSTLNWKNIMDFGARPEPGFDNSLAFAMAISELRKEGGGKVYVPRGDFPVSEIIINFWHIGIVGDGWGSTLVQMSGRDMIHAIKGYGLIADIRLRGDKGHFNTGSGINMGSSFATHVRNVYIENFPKYGIYQPAGATGGGWEFHYVRVNTCLRGIYLAGGYDNKFVSCIPLLNTGYGIVIDTAVTGTQMVGCRPNYNGTPNDVTTGNMKVSGPSQFSDCMFDNSCFHGVTVDGMNSIFNGCLFNAAGKATADKTAVVGEPAGLVLTGKRNVFSGCIFKYNQYGSGALVQDNLNSFTGCHFRYNALYGMDMSTGVKSCSILGNVFDANTTANENFTATQRTDNYIHHNYGDSAGDV